MNFLSNLNPFKKVEAKDMATESIAEYKVLLITHQEAAEYSHKMAEYYRGGIERLAKHIY